MAVQTTTETVQAEFEKGLGGSRFTALFNLLKDSGLRPLGKSNTGTLLFQFTDMARNTYDVLAFRTKPESTLSFPKSYWASRSTLRSEICAPFKESDKLPITVGVGSYSNESAGQIAIKKETFERVKALCEEVCRHVKNNDTD